MRRAAAMMSRVSGNSIVPILMYHQVAHVPEQLDPKGLSMSPEQFEEQMAFLHQSGYRCISLRDAVHYSNEGRSLPRKSFVITFDDGYRDLYDVVSPVLKRFGFAATVFLVAGRAGVLSDWAGQSGPAAAPLLSWEEARELSDQGITFGSHTLTHPRLSQLNDEEARHQIVDSKVLITERLDVEVDLFSYPHGVQETRIQRMVSESGYIAACGVDRGDRNRFNLWRLTCRRTDSQGSFAMKMVGWPYFYYWARNLYHKGRRYTGLRIPKKRPGQSPTGVPPSFVDEGN